MTLTDALAAALGDLFPHYQREKWPFTAEQAAAAILADPAFREALEGLRLLAQSGAAYAHLNEAGVMVRHNGTLWECKAERCIKARELAWTPEERAAKAKAYREDTGER